MVSVLAYMKGRDMPKRLFYFMSWGNPAHLKRTDGRDNSDTRQSAVGLTQLTKALVADYKDSTAAQSSAYYATRIAHENDQDCL